jgi:hypothetical protein
VIKECVKLSAEEQGVLAACYLEGRACEESSRGRSRVSASVRSKISAGRDALSLLIESMVPLLGVIADEHINSRIGHEWGDKEREDAKSEALLAAVEALGAYDPERSTRVHQWVAQQVRLHLSALDYDTAGGLRPREWRRVSKVAFTEIENRKRDGKSTATKDVASGVYEHFYNETFSNIQLGSPHLSHEEVDKATRERLSRQSITRAITKDMAVILETSQLAASLDAETDEDGGTMYDTLCGDFDNSVQMDSSRIVRDMLGTLSEDDIDCVLSVSGGSVPQAESSAYATRHGLTVAQARAELRGMSARLTAPHAQYAALAHVIFDREDVTEDYESLMLSANIRLGV